MHIYVCIYIGAYIYIFFQVSLCHVTEYIVCGLVLRPIVFMGLILYCFFILFTFLVVARFIIYIQSFDYQFIFLLIPLRVSLGVFCQRRLCFLLTKMLGLQTWSLFPVRYGSLKPRLVAIRSQQWPQGKCELWYLHIPYGFVDFCPFCFL